MNIEPKFYQGKNYLWNGTDISIAANASYVFSPSQGLVSITYIDDDNEPFTGWLSE